MSTVLKKSPKRRRSAPKASKSPKLDLASLIEAIRASGASEAVLPDGTIIKFHVEQSVKTLDTTNGSNKDTKTNQANTTALNKTVPDISANDLIKPESVFDQYTEDEILFWSTSYYDELQARKEAQEQARKERE